MEVTRCARLVRAVGMMSMLMMGLGSPRPGAGTTGSWDLDEDVDVDRHLYVDIPWLYEKPQACPV